MTGKSIGWKLGPTLRTVLTDISDDVEDPIMEYVNERTMKGKFGNISWRLSVPANVPFTLA